MCSVAVWITVAPTIEDDAHVKWLEHLTGGHVLLENKYHGIPFCIYTNLFEYFLVKFSVFPWIVCIYYRKFLNLRQHYSKETTMSTCCMYHFYNIMCAFKYFFRGLKVLKRGNPASVMHSSILFEKHSCDAEYK